MKTIILIRHAKSSWDFPLPDHKRPLNERGKKDVAFLAEKYFNQIKDADQIYCSVALRAKATIQAILKENISVPIVFEKKWYEFDAHALLNHIHQLPKEQNKIVLVGHNPAFHEVTEKLTNRSVGYFPTCTLAEITCQCQDWSQFKNGTLTTFWYPKMFKNNFL